MPIVHVADAIAGTSVFGGTTSAIDTTGADFLVAVISWYSGSGGNPTLSDNYGNAWTPLTTQTDSTPSNVRIYYCASATVGTGHTFTVSGVSIFAGLYAAAFSGVRATPFDQESGSTGSGVTSVQPGAITPVAAGSLVIAGLEFLGSSGAIDGGFTGSVLDYVPGSYLGTGGAYLIQTLAVAANPTWSWSGGSPAATALAAFAPATSPPPPPPTGFFTDLVVTDRQQPSASMVCF